MSTRHRCFFGELSILSNSPIAGSVVVTESFEAQLLSRAELDRLREEYPELYVNIQVRSQRQSAI